MSVRAVETEAAPAKVNLALHVTGRRPDGYHLLDSLVVFAGNVADRVTVAEASELSLRVTGPFAASVPSDGDNLVLRAARAFGARRGAAITLEKNLPVASGIGGGSADAAAALRALSRLWRLPLPPSGVILALGADVPVCLAGRPVRMRGVGEELEPLPGLAPVHLLLVNPGIPVSTPQVFARLAEPRNPPLPEIPAFADVADLARFAALCRNDLQPAATALVPGIAEVVAAMAGTEGCLLARMSGSGATCFGLYPDAHLRDAARAVLSRRYPAWWVAG
jgi:4-diphosphocytidyl-2-C-methyl-D-erythritol kinase